jgi:D-alanine-D-alanine ligase
MARLARIINPDSLDVKHKIQVKHYALRGYKALGCAGVVRFDFLFYRGRFYFNEINVLPGSLAFYLWEKRSPPLLYTDLLSKLIESSIKRFGEKRALKRTIDSSPLR